MDKWISVKERLPEPLASVQISAVRETRRAGTITRRDALRQGEAFWHSEDGWCFVAPGCHSQYSSGSILESETEWKVTHWMPLPDPPETSAMTLPVAGCGDCLYFEEQAGECRRSSKGGGWMRVRDSDWCGEFVHREFGERIKGHKKQWRFPTEPK